MATPQKKKNQTKPDPNRDEPKERERVILVWPYKRAVIRKITEAGSDGKPISKDKTIELPFISRVRFSTVKQFGLEKLMTAPILEDKDDNLRLLRGSVGAKSWKLRVRNGNTINTYSFPVPSYATAIDFLLGVVKNIPANKRPASIVTPHGVTFTGQYIEDTVKQLKPPTDVGLKPPEQINDPSRPSD